MKSNFLYLLLILFLFSQCKVNKNNTPTNQVQARILEEITISGNKSSASSLPYQASHKRTSDLLHTILRLSFDYNKQHVYGKAELIFKPYFYDLDSLEINARSFILNRVALIRKDTVPLQYTYDNNVIRIRLDKTYSARDTFRIFIDYTARPSEIKEQGSPAISDARGLYFINPDRKDPLKPRQIWSQGETQSNSGWFPTIDYPNEKMTQEIYLTVDATDVTLSNGILMYSKDHDNQTRTDYWVQKLPSAPYLTMIAVGEFKETKDFWRDSIEVNYYLEKEYHPYARLIFGNTPEMMEFFSTRLGVDYPWEKFSQVVVRDFVSGAMENTTAVVHYDQVQHDHRQHLDNNMESIIAHELFHHWFGDLVTCESWSNLALNESFATYGEYLWNDYKYGRMFADYEFDDNLTYYLNQRNAHKKDLVRYHYHSREDMFDVVSYQKGSRVLHMLRNYLGDEAFFASLKLYLDRHRFKTVEIHDLRLACEEVSGEDLNWFFNQWFLNHGHPALNISYTYNENRTSVTVSIKQKQDTSAYGVFRLPIAIDVYSTGKPQRHRVVIDNTDWKATFTAGSPIGLVNVDADKMLLATISDSKTLANAYYQFGHAPLFKDKEQASAIIIASNNGNLTPELRKVISDAFNHSFYGVRELGLDMYGMLSDSSKKVFEPVVAGLVLSDPEAAIRSAAITALRGNEHKEHAELFRKAMNDSSYNVVGSALLAIADQDPAAALTIADSYLQLKNDGLQVTVSTLIADEATSDYTAYFEQQLAKKSVYNYPMLNNYILYLQRQDTSIVLKALPGLKHIYANADPAMKSYFSNVETMLSTTYDDMIHDADEALKNKKLKEEEKQAWISKKEAARVMITKISAITAD
jgi:aminopeptidase N